jgi:hypothetical protein
MPRKKIDSQNNEPVAVPKRTRKTSPKREFVAEVPEIDRPRIMSAAEKHQLILAHAANRQPIDPVQKFSLWTGVAICILVIGVGWVYTMRQSILGALATDSSDQNVNYSDLRESMHGSINNIVEKIDSMQEKELQELREQAILNQVLNDTAQSIASTTTDVLPTEARNDLFKPDGNGKETVSDSNQFRMPEGIIIESNN